jgi:hypothetical protein
MSGDSHPNTLTARAYSPPRPQTDRSEHDEHGPHTADDSYDLAIAMRQARQCADAALSAPVREK